MEARSKRVLKVETKSRYDSDHVIPKPADMDRERKLRKLGTRGVVKLFNALNEQKRSVDQLQKESKSFSVPEKKLAEVSKESIAKLLDTPKWSVVTDTFMADAKFKDWDDL